MYLQTRRILSLFVLGAFALMAQAPAALADTGKNPCAMKNPCAAKNPCVAQNPCAARLDAKLITRPAGTRLASGDHKELVKYGEQLFKDTKLSSNGLSCNACHADNQSFRPSFAKPYPHTVNMVKERAGIKRIHLDEMVQVCMVIPMAAKPLPWDSKELAALTAYAGELQKSFKRGMDKNPRAMKNPCGMNNLCAGNNPCAAKNPCAVKK